MYLELFKAAIYNLEVTKGTEMSLSCTNLFKASAVATRHAIGRAVSLAANMMQVRRALATSNLLSNNSKGIP